MLREQIDEKLDWNKDWNHQSATAISGIFVNIQEAHLKLCGKYIDIDMLNKMGAGISAIKK